MNPTTVKNFIRLEDVITHKGEEWRNVLELARQTIADKYLSDRNLIRLTKGAATISQTQLMIKLLLQDSIERPIGQNGIDIFFRVVDHSRYSLSSWLSAITFFDEWLKENNRTTSFQKMLGYLQCCEDSPEDKEREYSFIDLVKEMTIKNGFVD